MVAQVISLIVLARILPPSDFGVIAIASVVTGFGMLFRDFGTAAAVIQQPVLAPALLDAVFWFNIMVGLCLAFGVVALSPVLVWFFSEPKLLGIIGLLGLVFPVNAAGLVQQSLFERASEFRPVAIVESVGVLSGLAMATVAALYGWGVYSLVTQTLVTAVVTTVGFWWFSPWRPGRTRSFAEVRPLLRFGGNLVGFHIFNYFSRNADNLLIGRFLGASELGYYSLAYRLMLWPLQNISSVVGRALFPVFSRFQEDRSRLADAYIKATMAVTVLTSPLIFGFFVLREPFIAAVLGKQWLPVADILTWLLPVGFLQVIGSSVGSLYMATGRTDVMFKWGVAASLLVLPAFIFGLQWGVVGVAVGYAIASSLLFWPSLAIPLRFVGLKVPELIIRIMPPVMSGTAMGIAVAGVAHLWPETPENQLSRLTVLVGAGAVIYAFISAFTQRQLLTQIVQVVFNRRKAP